MRIIDKNTDFYDYLQNIYIDKSIVFDRTDSFLLTKEILCNYLNYHWRPIDSNFKQYNFLLLQVCNTFWLFLIEILETTNWYKPTKYNIELISSWKNYNKYRKLIDLSIIEFSFSIKHELSDGLFGNYDKSKIMNKNTILMHSINDGDFKVYKNIDSHTVYYGSGMGVTKAAKHIPLLKACGVADFIDPIEIFLAFEEYFSLEKSLSERIESVGLTNTEIIENHGFDKKKSFRSIK